MKPIAKTLLLAPLLLFVSTSLWSQTPNFSEHIAPILYAECASCHNDNGIAPFPLIKYQDAFLNRLFIENAVSNGSMPPWPPDTTFQHYANERVLSNAEVALIQDWVNGGAPQGDSTLAPPPPVFSTGAVLGTPDLQLTMPTYTSTATVVDDYVCFVLDMGLIADKKIKAIEVLPGNRKIVHHVLLYLDTTGVYVPDSAYQNCGGPVGARLLGGYVPGGGPIQFPDAGSVKMGMTAQAGSQVILAMHFPEGSVGEKDSTQVNFYFYPDSVTNVREVLANSIIENWNFCIPPDTVISIDMEFPPSSAPPLQNDFSILSVFPHMHQVGSAYDVYALDLAGDTIPFARIPKWDFEWQGFYFFDFVKKLPAGSRIYSRATYDNTVNNHHNPNFPPQQVCAGLNTSDEMYLVYFHYLPYQTGDEFLNLDSLLQVPTAVREQVIEGATPRISGFPNPFRTAVTLDYYVPHASPVRITISDIQGRVLRHLWAGNQPAGQYHTKWDHRDDAGNPVPNGIYFARLHLGDRTVHCKLVLQD